MSTNLRVSYIRPEGIPITIDRGYRDNDIPVQNNTMRPVIACRLRAVAPAYTNIFAESINCMSNSGANARWAVIINPPLEVGGAPTTWDSLTWTQEGATEVEYHVPDGTYEIIPDGNNRLASGYISNNNDYVREMIGWIMELSTEPFVLCIEGLSTEGWFGQIQLRDVT